MTESEQTKLFFKVIILCHEMREKFEIAGDSVQAELWQQAKESLAKAVTHPDGFFTIATEQTSNLTESTLDSIFADFEF